MDLVNFQFKLEAKDDAGIRERFIETGPRAASFRKLALSFDPRSVPKRQQKKEILEESLKNVTFCHFEETILDSQLDAS